MNAACTIINRASLSDQIVASAVSSICSKITIAKPILDIRMKKKWLDLMVLSCQELQSMTKHF